MMIENRMVVDSEWESSEHTEVEDNLKESGYHEFMTDTFVPESEAYEYALERCLHGTDDEQREFKEMLVEWFYSGNWVKEDGI